MSFFNSLTSNSQVIKCILYRDNTYEIAEKEGISEGTSIEIHLKAGDSADFSKTERVKEVRAEPFSSPNWSLRSYRKRERERAGEKEREQASER